VDYENRVIRVDDKHDLEESAGTRRSPDQKLLVVLNHGEGRSSASHDLLCLVGLDAVRTDVFLIPSIPPKEHPLAIPS
jgi:hypothetical protein